VVGLGLAGFFVGLAGQSVKVASDTIVQEDVDDDRRGRVFALYDVGVIARVVTLVKQPTHYDIVLQGLSTFRTITTLSDVPFIRASIESFASEDPPTEADAEALRRDALDLFTGAQVPPQLVELLKTFPGPQLASFLATQLGFEGSGTTGATRGTVGHSSDDAGAYLAAG
jgi:hypothetical protein